MAIAPATRRVAAAAWFVAAGLALIAFVIRFVGDGVANWTVAAAGVFCLVAGIATMTRNVQPPAL